MSYQKRPVFNSVFDSYNFAGPERGVFFSHITNRYGRFLIQAGLEPGKAVSPLGVEDRAMATESLFAVFDGVGEIWVPPVENRATYTALSKTPRTLGDMPGFLLSRLLLSYSLLMAADNSSYDLRTIVREASETYRNQLGYCGIDPSNDKELFGGCTFAVANVRPDGTVEIGSAGDAIAIVIMEEGAILSTPNQLPNVNLEMEAVKKRYYAELGEIEGRRQFNAEYKHIQRNEWANSRYAFFDGNPQCAELMNTFEVHLESIKHILLLTDGAFDASESDQVLIEKQIVDTFQKYGIEGLLSFNQSSTKPEATVIEISRI